MKLISPRELAIKLNLDLSTIYRKIKSNEIPSTKVPVEVIRVPWDELKQEVCQTN